MRCFLLLSLTACWSPSSSPPPATTAPTTAPAALGPPAPAAPRAYQLPSEISDALASEQLVGNVLVPSGVHLFAREVDARGASVHKVRLGAIAMRVVRDLGDVVEVETARVTDCMTSFAEPYALNVFVRRDRLVPRAQNDRVKAFADGTGVVIDAGAPVEITAAGLAWMDADLAALPIAPSEHQLAYAVRPSGRAATLSPIAAGDYLVCDASGARTLDEWRASRQAERDAERREEEAERRARQAAAQAQWEAERPAREAAAARARKACRAKEAKEAKRAKQKRKNGAVLDPMVSARSCDLAFIVESVPGPPLDAFGGGFLTTSRGARIEQPPPACGVSRPYEHGSIGGKPAVPPPMINGIAMPWPDTRSGRSQGVVRVGGKLLADVEYGCGRARMEIAEARPSGTASGIGGIGGIGTMGGQAQVQVWVPKAGPVTWPDGTPAGTYTGRKRYATVTEMGDRFCVRVPNVAEAVCHEKRTAKTEMVHPGALRD